VPSATCNGIEIAYEVEGSGEPLLMIMGIGSQMSDWSDGLKAALGDAGFQLILFDNRDMGFSSRLPGAELPSFPGMVARGLLNLDLDAPYSLEDMADDAAALVTHLGHDTVHVLGVSLGGMIAQTFALRHPGATRSLTSIMSSAGRRRNALGTPAALKALMSPPAQTAEDAEAASLNFVRVCGSKAWPIDEDEVRLLARRSFERNNDKSGFLRQLAAVVKSGSRYKQLRSLDVPTAVIHGALDPLVRPSAGRDTARAIPGATLRIIEGMGHDLPPQVWPIIVDEVRAVAARAR
jgi:pimeloyl-ACP methyl ester carboxylesterase